MPTQRHTVSFLKQRFAEAGVRPITKYGQNFLIDLNLQRLLVDTAELAPQDVVLEVGTGTGALTAEMARLAAAVVTVEVDPCLYQLAQEELEEFDNITMLHQDALKNKNRFAPELLDVVSERLAAAPDRRLKLVANLPYNIATPVISNLLRTKARPVLMAATIQKEVADRLTARPSVKDYGALSVWVQSQCHTSIVRVLPPTVFWPRPKVHSAIVRVEPDEALRRRIGDAEFFHRFIRSIFLHRRKFLRANLLSTFKEQLDKPEVDQLMEEVGLDSQTRPEELSVEALIELSEAARRRVGGRSGGFQPP